MWAEIMFYKFFTFQSVKSFQYKRFIQTACLNLTEISCLNKSLLLKWFYGEKIKEYDFCAHREYLANNAAQLSQFEIISVNWLLCYGFLVILLYIILIILVDLYCEFITVFILVPGSRSTFPDADPDPAKWYRADRIRIRIRNTVFKHSAEPNNIQRKK